VAVLNTLSALSMPVLDRRANLLTIVVWLVLLSAHAALYWFGEELRGRFGVRNYAIAQAAVVFVVAVTRAPIPVVVGLFMASTAELVLLEGAQWGAARITIGAIAVFVLAALVRSDIYQATTAGLALAVTGVIAHAIAGLIRGRTAGAASESPLSTLQEIAKGDSAGLSSRETEVLRELVSGARSSDIAATLGISERTVKAHLKSIYQKLHVESRTAAVATAIQRKLV
jgi:DNA-binding CsgD family transcriptional regulator